MTRILIAGAGATGGALGARLLAAGRDVTFLVRERRQAQLADHGLRFSAPDYQGTWPVRAVTALADEEPFDLVIVAVKAPALASLIPELAGAMGNRTRILPLLNGMAHIDALEQAFGGRVLGGIVKIVATLDEQAVVQQLTGLCQLGLGGLHGQEIPEPIIEALDVGGIELGVLDDVLARLWEKWAFIAAAGVITCLFRGNIGDILAAGGEPKIREAVGECERIASAAGYPVSEAGHEQSIGLLTEPGSSFTSSLYRDLGHGTPVEAEHIIGDLAARAQQLGVAAPLLDAALLQLRTHQQSLDRAGTSAAG
ncbi:ketopantoate reductase family protein [Glutamicibacter sp. 2E12]|uniref:ketopantoate reductase family protein n=1 Tax=Glutamicibacter sp. 2E12 TaxID=3416181 RepID=UPI003CEE8288